MFFRKGLTDKEIEFHLNNIEVADIPSDLESISSDFEEEIFEENIVQDALNVLLAEERNFQINDEQFDSEDDIPLAQKKIIWRHNQVVAPPKWSKVSRNVTTEPFIGHNHGPSSIIESLPSHEPIDIFNEHLTTEIIDDIVFQTNLYCQQTGKYYEPTNHAEIKLFIGINFLMGVKPLPSYRDYWSSRPELNDSYISSRMSVKRFGWLLSLLSSINYTKYSPS